MLEQPLVFYIFLIFTGASILATAALFTRQSLIVAYIALGAILGPWGTQWVSDPTLLAHLSDIGIIFLLFLLGLNLDPKNLVHLLKNTTVITLVSSFLFALIGYGVAYMFGFSQVESVVIASTMMFSSTIIGLKLLPTTILHHQRTGEIVISILLLQDIIAIAVMMILETSGGNGQHIISVLKVVLGLPAMIVFCLLFERFVLLKLIERFDRIQEYIFLVAIGWCLGIAELSYALGLSHEIGAFIAGVSIATSPISLFIAESLKPLRDFFLVLFFFALGATLNFGVIGDIWVPALLLGGLMLLFKPGIFWLLLRRTQEADKRALEIGVRLGQISEFSLLVAYIAKARMVIGDEAYNLIQVATIITFVVSSYYIVWRYPTPISLSDNLRRD
jgi:Kef-type K+ transport system membrane component KefB